MKLLRKASLALLAVCAMVLCTVLCAANLSAAEVTASGECGDNLTWTLYDDGELVIDGEGAMGNMTSSSPAPWSEFKTQIVKVTIGNKITRIGYNAFEFCPNLTSVTIPNSVTFIGKWAFFVCDSLTDIAIPNSVTVIGDSAFANCDSLTDITIPESVTFIGVSAFSSCESLTSITVDKNNPNYANDEAGVLFDKAMTSLIQYPAGRKAASYTIPDGVASVGDVAFHRCSNLTNIIIPVSVTKIGNAPFAYCDSLTSVTVLSKNVEFSDLLFINPSSDLTLFGYTGSTTETYAAANGHRFVPLDAITPGDISGDGTLDINDSIALFQYSMMPELYPVSYTSSMDFTKDGTIDIADAIHLFRHTMMPDIYPID